MSPEVHLGMRHALPPQGLCERTGSGLSRRTVPHRHSLRLIPSRVQSLKMFRVSRVQSLRIFRVSRDSELMAAYYKKGSEGMYDRKNRFLNPYRKALRVSLATERKYARMRLCPRRTTNESTSSGAPNKHRRFDAPAWPECLWRVQKRKKHPTGNRRPNKDKALQPQQFQHVYVRSTQHTCLAKTQEGRNSPTGSRVFEKGPAPSTHQA